MVPSPWIPTWEGCHLPEEQARCCHLHRGGPCPHWAPARKEQEHHGGASRGSAETLLLMTLPEPGGPAGLEPESPKTFVTRLHPRLGCSAGRSLSDLPGSIRYLQGALGRAMLQV